jgi:hypothetical protein
VYVVSERELRSLIVASFRSLPFPQRVSEWLDAFVVAVTLIGGGLASVFRPPGLVTVTVGVLLFFLYLWASQGKRSRDYVFPRDSEELASFFRKWYSRTGTHTVFCDDLDWMEGPVNAPIAEALREQGAQATVCLRKVSGDAVDRFQASGVHVYQTAPAIRTHTKFSIREEDDQAQMIVRVKYEEDDEHIRFRRVTDRFAIGLARDLVQMTSVDAL